MGNVGVAPSNHLFLLHTQIHGCLEEKDGMLIVVLKDKNYEEEDEEVEEVGSIGEAERKRREVTACLVLLGRREVGVQVLHDWC